MKVCIDCGIEKELSEFYFRKDSQKYREECKDCFKKNRRNFYKNNNHRICLERKNYRETFPWRITLTDIKKRCNNPKNNHYYCYGKRGIKCLITEEELEKLWFRDSAYLMEKPSIDREDNDGNYTLENCRYMELSKNVARKTNNENKKSIFQFTKNSVFIKKWDSIIEASTILNIHKSAISKNLNGCSRSSGGFIWRYAK